MKKEKHKKEVLENEVAWKTTIWPLMNIKGNVGCLETKNELLAKTKKVFSCSMERNTISG